MESHTLIVLVVCCVVAAFLITFVWKLTQNVPLKIRRKRLRILAYLFILIMSAMYIESGFSDYGEISGAVEVFKKDMSNRGTVSLCILIVVAFSYSYFRKDKTPNEKDITEEQINE